MQLMLLSSSNYLNEVQQSLKAFKLFRHWGPDNIKPEGPIFLCISNIQVLQGTFLFTKIYKSGLNSGSCIWTILVKFTERYGVSYEVKCPYFILQQLNQDQKDASAKKYQDINQLPRDKRHQMCKRRHRERERLISASQLSSITVRLGITFNLSKTLG